MPEKVRDGDFCPNEGCTDCGKLQPGTANKEYKEVWQNESRTATVSG